MVTATATAPRTAPGPRGHRVLGSLPELRRDRMGLFMSALRDYGDIARLKLGPVTAHLLGAPAYVQHVLQTNNRSYSKQTRGFEKLRPLLGNGLLTSEGEFWLRQRRIAQPAFHRERIASFAGVMVAHASELADDWAARAARGEVVDVAEAMMRLTLRIVGKALLGTEIAGEADVVGRALPVAMAWANRQLSSLGLGERLPTPANRAFRAAVGDLNRVVHGLIAQRRQSGEDPGDLLSMLMKATDAETGERMSDQQLRDEVMTIFLAGHETTANALAWTFMLLSQHPGPDRALRAELKEVLGGRPPTLADLPRLSYTRMVLDEALRLYPPAWSFGRRAEADDVIDGYAIPRGSLCLLSPFVVHRNPRVWSNPEGFDPERFRPGWEERLPRFAYFPFGGGPRLCIGNNFALMEAQLLLAVLAQRVRPELLPGHRVELEPMITLRPRGGLPMRLVPA